MKNIRYILLVIPMLFMMTACEDFLDVNRDRDMPTGISIDQALPPIIFFAMQINYDHAEYTAYLSQMFTTANVNPRTSYAYSGGWDFQAMNRHPMWRRHFYDIGTNNRMMMDRALAQGARNYYLIGQTIRLMSTMLTVDVFGDMPHHDAFLMNIDASATPRYDSQQDIYRWLFQEVEDLLDRFADRAWTHAPTNPNICDNIDWIFGGDMDKWAAFAKALRARLWLRVLPNGFVDEYGNPMTITHRGQSITLLNNPDNARRVANYARIALENPHWQEPSFCFTGGPALHSSPWGPSAPNIGGWESRRNRLAASMPTSFFADAILGAYTVNLPLVSGPALDPRAARMMTPRGAAGTPTIIRWIHSNSGTDGVAMTQFPDMTAGGMGATNPFTANNGCVILFLHEELLFIKAEGQYWAGYVPDAFETTREAVLHNMARWGVIPWGCDGSSLVGPARTFFDRFMAVRLPGAATFTIANLMQQKFVAMYLQAEQWTDMRRYNFSSPRNGIAYITPSSPDGVFVYLVRGIHDTRTGSTPAHFAPARFTDTYSLRRPANLWIAVWGTPDNFGAPFAELSPNAWPNRLNYDPETEPRFNSGELNRIGAMIGTEVVPDWVRNRLIWQFNTSGHAMTANPEPWR